MMKRLISLLLSLCIVAGLFACMTTTAYADGDTQKYTVVSGDNLYAICAKLKVDYAKNLNWIVNTNNLKNPDKLDVGQVLTMPAEGKILTWTGSASTSTSTTTPSSTISTGTTTSYSVPTVTYELKSGDFVSTVCKTLGIDFNANDAWIRAANNITSYNNLKVGRVLVLPAPGTTPALSTAAASGTAAISTVATTTTTSGVGLLAGDSVAYYLFDYVVRSGDTLAKICSTYGANMATVQKLNNIAKPEKIYVNQKLSIPSTVVPSTAYTRVVSHPVVSGDTVAKICSSYGVSYTGTTITKIKALNNRDNLDKIQVGEKILIPVPGTGSGSSQSSAGSSAITNGATGAVNYTLNKIGATHGTYSLTVNGQSINGASAGQSVHVVATPDHKYKLDKIEVVKEYNGEAIAVDKNNNFVMPACNVSVKVSFVDDPEAASHELKKSTACASVALTYVVNGYANATAEKGQTVTLVLGTLTPGYLVDKVYVTTVDVTDVKQLTDGTVKAENFVSVSSSLSFTMPGSNVFVTVILKGA